MSEQYELSEREIEIIRLVATGASNKEIAQALVISPNTVKVHLRNIFTKLEVASRTEATMVAIREGWVNAPGADISSETSEHGSIEDDRELATAEGKKRRRYLYIGAVSAATLLIFLVLWATGIFQPETNPVQDPPQALSIEGQQRWEELASIPIGLSRMGAARYEQSFYLVGGQSQSGFNEVVYVYDLITDKWTTGSEKPTSVADVGAVLLGERVYVPGGVDESNSIVSVLESYDPRTDTWDQHAEMPKGLAQYAAAAYEGKLYLFGGWDGNQYSNDVYSYDPDLDEWTLFAEMNQASAGAAVVVLSGKIHVLGGQNDDGVLAVHDIFVPQRERENENPWESAAQLPEGRYGMGATVLADMIYLAGGYGEAATPTGLIQYLPPKDSWVPIDQPPEPVGLAPAVLPFETRLYVLGGEVENKSTAAQQVYQAVYTILVPVVR